MVNEIISFYLVIDTSGLVPQLKFNSVDSCCRSHRLNECAWYDTKQSDGEAPVLKL